MAGKRDPDKKGIYPFKRVDLKKNRLARDKFSGEDLGFYGAVSKVKIIGI